LATIAPQKDHERRVLNALEGGMMQAKVGDTLVVKGHHLGDKDREAVIIEVRGANGAPPYLVRWHDDHESVFYPSSDTVIEHVSRPGTTETPAPGRTAH
jgi:hypothetical protein